MSYPGPVNYRDSSGQLQAIDDTATSDSSGGWKNTAGLYQASVPSTLAGKPVTVTSGNSSVSFTLDNAGTSGTGPSSVAPTTAAGSANEATVTYPDSLPATNLSYAFGNVGVDETLSLASAGAPVTYNWSLSTSAGLTASMAPSGYVSIKDARGTEVMRLTAPSIEDAAHLVGPAPTMSLSPDGTVLSVALAPDASWLADPARTFPVAVDPSVTVNVPQSGSECELIQSLPSASFCGSTTSYDVGYNSVYTLNSHTLFRFDNLASSVPYDSLVQNAVFGVYEQGAVNSNSIPVTLNPQDAEAWSPSSASWNDSSSGTPWYCPGGYNPPSCTLASASGTVPQAAGTGNGG
jgi:hypothetical protein